MPRTTKKETDEKETKLGEVKEEADEADAEEKITPVSKDEVTPVAGKKDEMLLTSLDDYIKTASYLGTKVITPTMRKYVYRRRLDGLAILNTNLVDKKLKDAIDFIVQFKPDEWTLVCKREAGWRAAQMFSELTGVRVFTKKYPAGNITNTKLPDFFETKMMMVCDPWLDKNALNDAKIVQIPIVSICDTNNHTADIDVVIIANNKSNKSLGLIFWLLTREYMKAHKINNKLPTLEDFAGEKLILEEPKKKRIKKETKTAEQLVEEKMREIETKVSVAEKEGV